MAKKPTVPAATKPRATKKPEIPPEIQAVNRITACNAASKHVAKRIVEAVGANKVLKAKGPAELSKMAADLRKKEQPKKGGDCDGEG